MIPAPHLNDYLKQFLAVPAAGFKPADIVKVTRVPYLTQETTEEEFSGFLTPEVAAAMPAMLDDLDGLIRTPFPIFRFCVDISGPKSNGTALAGVVVRSPHELKIISFHKQGGRLAEIFDIVWVTPGPDGLVSVRGKIFKTKDLRDVTFDTPAAVQRALKVTDVDPNIIQGSSSHARVLRDDDALIFGEDGKPVENFDFDPMAIKDSAVRQMVMGLSTSAKHKFISLVMGDYRKKHSGVADFDIDQVLEEMDIKRSREILDFLLAQGDKTVRELKHELRQIEEKKSLYKSVFNAGKFAANGDDFSSEEFFQSVYNVIVYLAHEYLAPYNFTAKVTPSANGKSVEWVQAREHYTTIHRKHEANNANVKAGDVVQTDRKTALLRTAHSRRAHPRLLKSSRYTYARGKTIQVRATWCGPKEWQDTAGQTYRILKPISGG